MASGTRTLRVNLELEEWRQLRIRAAEHDQSVAAYVTALLRAHLAQPSKRKRKDE